MGSNSYIQLPPDSTGKKLYTHEYVVGSNTVQGQVMHIADHDSPTNIQRVDIKGQAYTRFADGSPTLDAFGNLRASEAVMLGAYEFTVTDMLDLFSTKEIGSGTVAYAPVSSELVLSVSSAASDVSKLSTNRYHYYQPGTGNLILQTLSLSDSGKANNVRGWGYGDEFNGLGWRLNGTVLNCVIRSDVSGSVVDTAIPQSEWNGDKLDGTGVSGMILDLTKANFYWIDYAWLGVGAVRFGILDKTGSRVVCHTFENPNSNLGAYMATGTLPITYHNYNTGMTSGTSEMKLICAAVYSEANTEYTFWRFSDIERDPVEVTTNTHILSMRPKLNSGPHINRAGLYPESLAVYVSGGSVKLTIIDDATLSSPTWSISGEGMAQGDISSGTATGGSKFVTYYLSPGCHQISLASLYETNDEGYHTLAFAQNPEDVYTFSVVASKLDGTTVNVGACLSYRELR